MSTDKKTLLWVNGGGTFCKHDNAAKDDWKKDGDLRNSKINSRLLKKWKNIIT